MRALYTLPLLLALPVQAAEFDGSHPVSIAAREAVRACIAIGGETIDECAASSTSSPQHTAARLAARRAYEARASYVNSCKGDCGWKADILVMIGMRDAAQ